MSEPFIGQITMFGGNFAPRSWAFCNGQLLQIAQNTALFSILGTTYGGDGRTTFGLPDLRGRVALHAGTGPGLTNRRLGQVGGVTEVTLSTTELPNHGHTTNVRAKNAPADTSDPDGNVLAGATAYSPALPSVNLHSGSLTFANAGGGQPHTNVMPYQSVNFIIALQGLFPSRN